MPTASKRQLWLVVAVAALARLAFVSLLHNVQVSDAAVYDSLARHLALGDGYVFDGHLSAWWPIGFPAWLSLIYRVAGAEPVAGTLANVILGTVTAALTFQLARRISERAALPAGLAIALLPSHLAATNLLTTETLATTLWVGAVLALWPMPRPGRAAVGGVLLALGALVRPIMLLFAPIWFFALLRGRPPGREWTRAAVACTAAILAVLAPWAYRNVAVFGTPVLVSTNGGYILWVGNNPLASGRYLLTNGVHSFAYASVDPDVPRNEGEVGQDVAYRRRAFDYMRSHPLGIMRLVPAKLRYLWATDNDAVSWLLDGLTLGGVVKRALYVTLHAAALLAYLAVLAACVWVSRPGAVLRPDSASLMLVPALLVTLVHLVLFGDDRFHFPVMPFLIVFAAAGLTSRRASDVIPSIDAPAG